MHPTYLHPAIAALVAFVLTYSHTVCASDAFDSESPESNESITYSISDLDLNQESLVEQESVVEEENLVEEELLAEPLDDLSSFALEADVVDSSSLGGSFYASGEFLAWWIKGNPLPAMVTTSPDGTARSDAGVLGFADTQVLFGGDRIDGGLRSGVRLTTGVWTDAYQDWAFEFTGFYLGDDSNSGEYNAISDGMPILARPFYNTEIDAEDAQLVAFPGVLEGGVDIQSYSELYSTSVLLRHRWLSCYDRRLDLLTGYRHARFQEGLTVRESLITTDPAGLVQQGTSIELFDQFGTTNDFDGGELGISAEWYRGCWTFNMVVKLALGRVDQVLQVDGGTVITTPGDPAVTGLGGLLAQRTNVGTYRDSETAFLSELGLKLAFEQSDCLRWTIGYSLLSLTNVLRTGDQIDRSVNATQLPLALDGSGALSGDRRPRAVLNDTAVWAQGFNLGLELLY